LGLPGEVGFQGALDEVQRGLDFLADEVVMCHELMEREVIEPVMRGEGDDTFTVMVSANDTTPDYLQNKLQEGTGIDLSVDAEGANEGLIIACSVVNTEPGWYHFVARDAYNWSASSTYDLYVEDGEGVFPVFPAFESAGTITACRAMLFCNGAAIGLDDGTVSIYPRKTLEADTQADGDVDTWTDGTDNLVLEDGKYSDYETGWSQLQLSAGDGLGCKAVTDSDYAHKAAGGPTELHVWLKFVPDS
jgi:hypothetical protein